MSQALHAKVTCQESTVTPCPSKLVSSKFLNICSSITLIHVVFQNNLRSVVIHQITKQTDSYVCALISCRLGSHRHAADHRRAKEFVELHDQVDVGLHLSSYSLLGLKGQNQTSVHLLESLESFLSTFQNDLSAVSGQISELQDRSKEIESRLKGRRVSRYFPFLFHPNSIFVPENRKTPFGFNFRYHHTTSACDFDPRY